MIFYLHMLRRSAVAASSNVCQEAEGAIAFSLTANRLWKGGKEIEVDLESNPKLYITRGETETRPPPPADE